MTTPSPLDLVDRAQFRQLFIDELGWNNPDRPDLRLTVDDHGYLLQQVAGYRGLRIWHCDELPDKATQRRIDQLVGVDNLERLVIFVGPDRQEWRWPRRAQTGGVNAKLLIHRHIVGQADPHLDQQLRSIEIDLDDEPTLVDLLSRMRTAFDVEAESASVQAARLMGVLYSELEASKVAADDATLLLARLLFLLFGDDGGMWKRDLFHTWLTEHTTDRTLHTDLADLFNTLNTEEKGRRLPAGSPLADFRYVNGDLFGATLRLTRLTPAFRAGLLGACEFDWQIISPAVFGSMFQTVKDQEGRRTGGEHYTTEANILKTIRPLFLDEYTARLEAAWNDKGQLTKLHNQLGELRVLDPACGCGNFLVVAYRELRALELELLKRRRDLDEADGLRTGRNRSQMTLDVSREIRVTLDHFFGIEIDPWPAKIAATAMLLVDHLANQRMEEEFGLSPDRLPIVLASTIVCANALRIDWEEVLPASVASFVLGNPPFGGRQYRTAQQQVDHRIAHADHVGHGVLDYVTGWFVKASEYMRGTDVRAAFVSTNSISQGENAAALWPRLLSAGITIDFAHRTFRWTSEATGQANVHVVIVGFSYGVAVDHTIFDYPDVEGPPVPIPAERISPYLVDAEPIIIEKRRRPLVGSVPEAQYGSMVNDGGGLLFSSEQFDSADPAVRGRLRPYVGGDEMLNGRGRWVLWLAGVSEGEIAASPEIVRRLREVRAYRAASKRDATRRFSVTPGLFTEPRPVDQRYLLVPYVSSSRRPYVPMAFYEPETLVRAPSWCIPGADEYLFGMLSSAAFMAWVRTVSGRLKSDLQLSPGTIYNPFPFPSPTDDQRDRVATAATIVLAARSAADGLTLAQLYDPESMPKDLAAAHADLDGAVDENLFGVSRFLTDAQRLSSLMDSYVSLLGILPHTGARSSSVVSRRARARTR